MQNETIDRRTNRGTPSLRSGEFRAIEGARHLRDVVTKAVLAGTRDEDIFYAVCEGYAHPRWKTPLSKQEIRITHIRETRIDAQRAMLGSKWLSVKEPGKVRCVYILRSCDGKKTWKQLLTTVSQ